MSEIKVYQLSEMDDYRTHFHQTFYQAFKNLPQTLLRRIWNVDDDKKVIGFKTEDKDVYVIPWLVDGQVYAYFAYKELKSKSFSQLQFFGFDCSKYLESSIEVLTLFRTEDPLPADLNLKKDFAMAICWNILKASGYNAAHATCTEKILPIYLRWGLEVVHQIEIDGFKRFYIMYNEKPFFKS
jgi:hypothetical protein